MIFCIIIIYFDIFKIRITLLCSQNISKMKVKYNKCDVVGKNQYIDIINMLFTIKNKIIKFAPLHEPEKSFSVVRSVVFHSLLLPVYIKKKNLNAIFFSLVSCIKWWMKMFLAQNICNNVGRHRNITIFVAMEHNLSQEQWSKIDLIFFAPVLQGYFIFSMQQFFLKKNDYGAQDFFRCSWNGAMFNAYAWKKV